MTPAIAPFVTDRLDAWRSETGARLALERAASGAPAIAIGFRPCGDANAITTAVTRDWTDARWLTFDVEVVATAPVALGFWCRDLDDRKAVASAMLQPGANVLSVDLDAIAALHGGARLDRARMKALCLYQIWRQSARIAVSRPRLTTTAQTAPRRRPPELAIAEAFTPLADYAGDLGAHRSPLVRGDGSRVADACAWAERRREILAAWHGAMGAWPPLLAEPRIVAQDGDVRDGIVRQRATVDVAEGHTLAGWLLAPAGATRRPAVITVFYEPDSAIGARGGPGHDWGRRLARRGFVVLSIGVQPFDPRDQGSLAFYPAGIQPLSWLAYVAANACTALGARAEVDAARIGVMGHSYGGKWAMFASSLHDGFAAAAVSDPGIVFDDADSQANYWEPWYLGRVADDAPRERGPLRPGEARRGAYAALVADGRDLTELHALMAPRPFLVSGGAIDVPSRWRALNHAAAVGALLGRDDGVAMVNRPDHPTEPADSDEIVEFFARALGPLP